MRPLNGVSPATLGLSPLGSLLYSLELSYLRVGQVENEILILRTGL